MNTFTERETNPLTVVAHFTKFLIGEEALLFGDFTTKSGRKSPYFFNFGEIYQADSLYTLAEFYGDWLNNPHHPKPLFEPFNTIFGPAYKGIPLSIALTLYLRKFRNNRALNHPLFTTNTSEIGYAFNRKELKHHGDKGQFVGAPLQPTRKILLVDDVLTSGMSLENTVQMIKESAPEAEIVGALVGIDREEPALKQSISAREALTQKYKFPVRAITNIRTLLDIGKTQEIISSTDMDRVLAYLSNLSTTSPA